MDSETGVGLAQLVVARILTMIAEALVNFIVVGMEVQKVLRIVEGASLMLRCIFVTVTNNSETFFS